MAGDTVVKNARRDHVPKHSQSGPPLALPQASPKARKWTLSWLSVLVAVLGLAGMLIFMYPSTAAWWSQWNQSRAIRELAEVIVSDPAPGNAARLEQAHQYNEELNAGKIVLGAGERKPQTDGSTSGDVLDYWDMLNPGTESGIMARIKIPAIDVDLPIYHGTSDETLAKGVGHLEGTSLPVGGPDTHTVLTAHRGLASATLFNNLNKLGIGDTFSIEVMGEVLTYRVFRTQVVEPTETKTLFPQPGKDWATLVTCTPLGINTHRILVTGERVTPTPVADVKALGKSPDIPGFPWWAIILPSGFVLAGVYLWRSGYPPKPRKKSAEFQTQG